MERPLESVLLRIFHPVKFPALFCGGLTQWLFQGETAISIFQMHIYDCRDPHPFSATAKKMLSAF